MRDAAMVPMSSAQVIPAGSRVLEARMGTAIVLSNTTIRLSPTWNAIWFWGTWAFCIASIGIVLWAALRSKRWERWTTQDILIVAALGVLLEVYDNIVGDQFIKPLVDVIPGASLL